MEIEQLSGHGWQGSTLFHSYDWLDSGSLKRKKKNGLPE